MKGSNPERLEIPINKKQDGSWVGGYDIQTHVNDLEGLGLKLLYENIVDVNQKLDYKIDAKGLLSVEIGHSPFPFISGRHLKYSKS